MTMTNEMRPWPGGRAEPGLDEKQVITEELAATMKAPQRKRTTSCERMTRGPRSLQAGGGFAEGGTQATT